MNRSDAKRRSIDWGEARRRVERAQQALEQEWRPSLEERTRLLKARAKALAREIQETAEKPEAIEAVEFLLADERYGIESSYVREVYPLKNLTPLPCTPPFVLGIVNLRGQILSVIDIKRFFDLPAKGLSELNKVVVLQHGDMELGILADAVIGVRQVPLAGMQAALPTLTDVRAAYLKGLTPERLIILDAAKLLSDPRIVVHEELES